MKIVYATPFLRVPPDFGHAIRNYHILGQLLTHHSVTVVTFGEDQDGSTDEWITQRGGRVLRLPFAFPWKNSSGYGATLRLLAEYPSASFKRFAPRALAACLEHCCRREPDTDLVIFDTQLTGQARIYSELPCPSILVLLDNYERVQWGDLVSVGWRPWKGIKAIEWVKTRSYERRILQQFHYLISVSETDLHFLKKHNPRAQVSLSPNGVDVEHFKPVDNNQQSSTLLLVGSFEYAPNVDAFFYFCREILPLIRAQRPDVHLIAAGRNPPATMKTFAQNDPTIRLTDTVQDIRQWYSQAALAVVPLRTGGGVKLKTLEAFAMGVPVVSTAIGCEGIAVHDGEHLVVADTPRAFAEKTIELLGHPERAEEMACRARKLVEERYDWKKIAAEFEASLKNIAELGFTEQYTTTKEPEA